MKHSKNKLMIRERNNPGFTLIELLVVFSIIMVLMAILFSVLNSVKKTARGLLCQSNLRSTGFSFRVYGESFDRYFPPAYTYVGGFGLNDQPEEPVNGIRHWSGQLIAEQYIAETALHCPEIFRGGLSPQNTYRSNLDPGQASGREGVFDIQALRCAFTVNEVLCPRNRFKVNFEGSQRPSRLVKISDVICPGKTILLTEWPRDWRVVSGPDSNLSFSYLPIHGFRGVGNITEQDRYDLNMTPSDSGKPCMSQGIFRRLTAYDLSNQPSCFRRNPPRLDWVGRNHSGIHAKIDQRKSSFFYADGHTELKSIYQTIEVGNFEWSNKIYSLTGFNSIFQ